MGLSITIDGLEHFVWGLEYYYSSENLIRATNTIEIQKRMRQKFKILIISGVTYSIVVGALCWFQRKVTLQGAQENIINVDGWPVLGFVVFNIISCVLIVVSISRFRKVQQHDTRVTESKQAVLLHLIFWVSSNFFTIGFLICQFTYVHTLDSKQFQAGEWFHIGVMIDQTFLQIYLAFIIYKLSQPTDMTNIIR